MSSSSTKPQTDSKLALRVATGSQQVIYFQNSTRTPSHTLRLMLLPPREKLLSEDTELGACPAASSEAPRIEPFI